MYVSSILSHLLNYSLVLLLIHVMFFVLFCLTAILCVIVDIQNISIWKNIDVKQEIDGMTITQKLNQPMLSEKCFLLGTANAWQRYSIAF